MKYYRIEFFDGKITAPHDVIYTTPHSRFVREDLVTPTIDSNITSSYYNKILITEMETPTKWGKRHKLIYVLNGKYDREDVDYFCTEYK